VKRSEKKRHAGRGTHPADDGRAAAEERAEKEKTPAIFIVGGCVILAVVAGVAGFEVHASWVGVLGGVAVALAFLVWRLGSGDRFL
jgi:hypothetical protein